MLNIFYSIFYIAHTFVKPFPHHNGLMQPAQQLSCDGCGIAKDDMRELERLDRMDELRKELFQNAARLHDAMRINAWLRPIFRKYKKVCREILNQKRSEAAELLALSEYCHANNPDETTGMKLIREELDHIHSQIEQLRTQDLYAEDTDEDTDTEDTDTEDTDSEDTDTEDTDEEPENLNDDDDCCSTSSTSSSSSSSSSSEYKDLEDFM